jgi:phosphatidate phosphatase LPIN
MNYIRGAISTISAPYQYYKDLPPINPSTLTGAIDVIVIQRPTSNGGLELACSPFHVRFGKWQVLRPGEKKVRSKGCKVCVGANRGEQVNVFVNGNPIPFNMKIGEAGEAFFIFETEDDIPDDLITSPLLEATQPADSPDADIPTGRFGTKQDKGEDQDGDIEAKISEGVQEPDFFDLDATPKDQSSPRTPSPEEKSPQVPVYEPNRSLPSSPPSPTLSGLTPSSLLARTGTKMDSQWKVDEYLQSKQSEVHAPDVLYKHGELDSLFSVCYMNNESYIHLEDIALDLEGYHSGGPVKEAIHKERSDTEYPIASTSSAPSASRTPQPSSCV